jgi:hypothetical protein
VFQNVGISELRRFSLALGFRFAERFEQLVLRTPEPVFLGPRLRL